MPRLLLLNGVPGAGKSTLARRYAVDHPGVLVCDIDRLRTMVAGWEDDFEGAGRLVRPAARAFLSAWLSEGHDVVVPQLVGSVQELDGMASVAARSGAEFVHVLLDVRREEIPHRFAARTEDEWLPQVRELIAASGGDDALLDWHDRVARVCRERPQVLVVRSTDGDLAATYADLARKLG